MTQVPIEVIHDEARTPPSLAARLAQSIALATFACCLGGIGIWDSCWRDDPLADARAQVLATADRLAPDIDRAWLDESPPPLPRRAVSAEALRAWARLPQLMFLAEINETLLRSLWQPGKGLSQILGPNAPREFRVFSTPDGSPFPRFRYPPNTTLPDGLTTNAFGFRGPQLALDKPPRTVRIAFVGASAIADNHYFPWSFPELVAHWLALWAADTGRDVRFEIINAGRESVTSQDIRQIVELEVLPLAVDYVVYYEGQNQFAPNSIARAVEVDGDYRLGEPPADLVLDLATADAERPHWLDRFCRDVESARRLRRLLGIWSNLPEPRKPTQRIRLPAGIDPDDLGEQQARRLLELAAILADLDAIDRACKAADARLVVCSFDRAVQDGMQLDLAAGHSLYRQLNREFWPLSYATVERFAALQNAGFAAWARAHDAPFLDIAAGMPKEPRLFSDMVHTTQLGSRLRGWLMFAGLVPLLTADLEAGRVPVPDTAISAAHPFLGPARRITAAELDGK
ncbi:MAG: hypothetical protein KDE27_00790 [Planctomycetes bacterium]|nr:hypothetical protein [Planctomycetota bacterium]